MPARKSDLAGSWYPGKESECRRVIEEFLRDCPPCPSMGKKGIGGIIPHAGWFYSGKVACNIIRCLKEADSPDTVVVFGRHLHPESDNYIMKEGRWATPLGNIEIDQELAEALTSEFTFRVETESRYEQDNTIELQLPFIKYFFPGAAILPIGVAPRAASLKIGERLAEISKTVGRKVFILGSTDLTHYGYNYGYTPKGIGEKAVEWVKNANDKKIIDLMLALDAEGIIGESAKNHNACCSGAAATAVAMARRLGAVEGQKLLYYTSYDIRPNDSFVGYVGILFHQ